jgi:hypothetical protein
VKPDLLNCWYGWRRQIESGKAKSITDLAEHERKYLRLER